MNLFRVPVSQWIDDPAAQVMTAAENELQVVKITGKAEDYYLVPVGTRLTTSKRVVVVVPPGEFDEREFALKVSRLSQWGRKDILLVGLASDPLQDSLLRRRMITLTSYLRAPRIETGYSLLFKQNWLEALKDVLQADDRVICLENHYTSGRWLRDVSLAQHLASSLRIPVCVIQSLRLEIEEERHWAGMREFLVWISLLLTIILFLLFQIRIQQTVPGPLGAIFLVISIVIEVIAILRLSALG